MIEEIKKFLDTNSLDYRESETHFQIDCFLCTDTRQRLGIKKETGAWNCFNCSSNGSKLSTLEYAFSHKSNIKTKDVIAKTEEEEKCSIEPLLHMQFYENIKNKKNGAKNYLINERNLTIETIKHFKLGSRTVFNKSDGEKIKLYEHLAIPYLIDDKCVNIKYRSLKPDVDKKYKWRREKGGISALFNDSALDNMDYDSINIFEAEIDAMSMWSIGLKNSVSLTVGAKGFKQAWYERLTRFKKIYIILDNDEAGEIGAKKLAKRLGYGRCYIVKLPNDVKDANDFIKKYTLKDFNRLVKKATQYEVENVISLRNSIRNLFRKKFIDKTIVEESYDTPWRKINDITGLIKQGYLWIVCGRSKVGKSTILLDMTRYWGKKNINVGIYTCEMNDERVSEKYIMMEAENTESIESIEQSAMKYAEYALPSDKIFMYYPQNKSDLDIDKVCDKVTEMVQRYGIEIFIFDNLHYLCRGDNENALIDVATQRFKMLAETLEILFVLVVHPRKTNNNKQLKNDDMKGTSSIFQDADLVWLLHRQYTDEDMTEDEIESGNSEGSMSVKAELAITGRWTDGGKAMLAFNGARSLFLDKGLAFNKIIKESMSNNKKRKKGL